DLEQLSREELARKIMEVTNAQSIGKQTLDAMVQVLEKMPNLPHGFMERFRSNASPEQLTELIVPIYVKNYDRETMIAAIRFYRSDRGRALVAGLPTVTKQSMEVGRTWGQALAKKTFEEMGASPQAPSAPRASPTRPTP